MATGPDATAVAAQARLSVNVLKASEDKAFTGLLSVGDVATAQAATRFLLECQQLPDGRLPRNSLLNGRAAPDTRGDQLDQTSYAT